MMLTGAGDDTKAFRERAAAMRAAVVKVAGEKTRGEEAAQSVRDFEKVFAEHRDRLATVGSCVERADRDYKATAEDYNACLQDVDSGWERTIDDALVAQDKLHAALTKDEWTLLLAEMGE